MDTAHQTSLKALELGQDITLEHTTAATDWEYEVTGVPIEDTTAGTITILVSLDTEGSAYSSTGTYTISAAALSGSDAESKTRSAAIGVSADLTGIFGLLSAESEVGTRPAIICAPDFDTGSGDSVTANALGVAMQTVAER